MPGARSWHPPSVKPTRLAAQSRQSEPTQQKVRPANQRRTPQLRECAVTRGACWPRASPANLSMRARARTQAPTAPSHKYR